ncbi:hypothetical protein DENSPDRAFT_835250 [Dentipellis sp. KUC8613]|nr:hypothetical protein DENSPDRAFT_835250 [Dentipellis sp. KUC8613]
MHNDAASEALYLVPNSEGTGKRLVRRPHPPPTTAPLPDDFDAITVTRGGTTVYDMAEWGGGSQPEVDYDAITVEPAYPPPKPKPSPQPASPRRANSPTRSLAGLMGKASLQQDAVGKGKGKANSVVGALEGSRSGRRQDGRAPGRTDLVQRKILEDGPERTISIWREGVAKSASEAGDGETEVAKSEVDSHAGRRRVSTESRRGAGPPLATANLKGKERAGRRSVDLTEGPRSPLQHSFSSASSPPPSNVTYTGPPQGKNRYGAPPKTDSGIESSGQSTTTTTQSKATSTSSIETVLSSCQPSLLHIAPMLHELGVRRDEHLRAIARMGEETRDREVKEEALKKGITVVEWAIFLDKLQSL